MQVYTQKMPREDDRTAQLLQRDPFYHAEVGGARGKLSDGIAMDQMTVSGTIQ